MAMAVKISEKEGNIYSRNTLISANTNRPVPDGEPITTSPVFWCDTCGLKLFSPTHAIQHLTGRLHRNKVKDPNPTPDSLKRKYVDSAVTAPGTAGGNIVKKLAVQEPDSKKTKIQSDDASSDQKHMCNDCSLVFNSASTAEQHFNGKKHKSVVTLKLSAAKKLNYCEHCQITLNSDGQVKQHYSGTRHKIKAGILKPNPGQMGPGGPPGGVNERGRGRGMRGGRGDFSGGRGRGDFSGRGDNSGRSRGTVRGGRGRGRGGDTSTNRGRGGFVQRGGWDRGGRGGNRGVNRGGSGGVTTGGQYGGQPPYNEASVNMQPIGNRATVPGAKSLLGDYFVNATSSPDHFQPEPQNTNFFNKPPPPGDYFGNQHQHTDYPHPPANPPREQRNGFFEARNEYYDNEAAMNEWGPPKQQPPKDYFGHGAPPPGKEYYGGNMPPPPKDYFPSPTGGPHKDPYGSGSQQNTFGGAPPKDAYNSPAQPSQPGGGNGNYNNFGSNDGYGNPHKAEYRMNTDATYDSFYV